MNRELVDKLVAALLYEGYLLYPYRPSVKNRQRWSFGGLYPPSYTKDRIGADASSSQTQCLLRGDVHSQVQVSIRFLHLTQRQVGQFDETPSDGPNTESSALQHVESLRVGGDTIHSWQEAVEREVSLDAVALGDLVRSPRRVEFAFGPGIDKEPIRTSEGEIVGLIERRQERLEGLVKLTAEPLREGVSRITVQIENRTPYEVENPDDRDAMLLRAMISTNTTLGVKQGEFISLLDAPETLKDLVAGCQNIGAWPVLVGNPGDSDTVLSSPIILYDHPQIAPESPGDLFDATEIDEILTLRIMTLTDEEKRTMATLDDRSRVLLERTEALARGQLMGLHGTMREFRPVTGGPSHG